MSPTPALRALRAAGVLGAADVHVAETLARLGGDTDPDVVLAAALAVRAPRHGHVAVDLRTLAETIASEPDDSGAAPAAVASIEWPEPDRWRTALMGSPLVSVLDRPDALAEPSRPLVVDGDLVFLQRYWAYERIVADEVLARLAAWPGRAGERTAVAATLLTGPGSDRQLAAVDAALRSGLTILAGGPGTGKTTTVAALLAVLLDQEAVPTGSGSPGADPGRSMQPVPDTNRAGHLRVALAAPTGKAAARLGEAFRDAASRLPAELAERLASVEASTIHRLLGTRPGSRTSFRHDRGHPLPHDVVIVDEASMVSLPLMARLLVAVRRDARVVIVGDPGQLASVDAGAVLGDLVGPVLSRPPGDDVHLVDADRRLEAAVVELQHSRRFPSGSPLDRLARAVRAGDADEALAVLADPSAGAADAGALEWIDEQADHGAIVDRVRDLVLPVALDGVTSALVGDGEGALAALDRVRLLCAHRTGPFGVATWNRTVETWLADAGHEIGGWYPGRPVMVTANDYRSSLFNGDMGITVDTGSRRTVVFPDVGGIRSVGPSRLDAIDTVHALTVHKSQGSEFDHVVVVLPDPESRLATRELIYTAITRARRRVTVVGGPAAITAAIGRRTRRSSGLGRRVWG